jgi:hypothetical protein
MQKKNILLISFVTRKTHLRLLFFLYYPKLFKIRKRLKISFLFFVFILCWKPARPRSPRNRPEGERVCRRIGFRLKSKKKIAERNG